MATNPNHRLKYIYQHLFPPLHLSFFRAVLQNRTQAYPFFVHPKSHSFEHSFNFLSTFIPQNSAIMHFNASVILAGLLSMAAAERLGPLRTRASSSFPIPASKGSVTYKSAKSISGTFDGGYKTYGRGVKCGGQAEGGNEDAVFILADGATLKNAIIGKDQNEGVHCLGACTIENVWWDAVCEDALTFKGNGNGKVIGGGARGAEDKVIQHNGVGSITIDGFTVQDFGKLYRSCGNCKQNG